MSGFFFSPPFRLSSNYLKPVLHWAPMRSSLMLAASHASPFIFTLTLTGILVHLTEEGMEVQRERVTVQVITLVSGSDRFADLIQASRSCLKSLLP